MSDALSFVQLDDQHAELLPARTVTLLFSVDGRAGIPGAGLALRLEAHKVRITGMLQDGPVDHEVAI